MTLNFIVVLTQIYRFYSDRLNLFDVTSISITVAQGGEGEEQPPAFQDKLTGTALVNALQGGGYIVYFRHAQTEKDYADQVSAITSDCSTQRILSEKE